MANFPNLPPSPPVTDRDGRGRVRLTILIAAAIAGMALLVSSAHGADAGRGKLLYENQCVLCHTAKIHARAGQPKLTREEVRRIAEDRVRDNNITWGKEEIDDVVEYLNVSRYHFAPK